MSSQGIFLENMVWSNKTFFFRYLWLSNLIQVPFWLRGLMLQELWPFPGETWRPSTEATSTRWLHYILWRQRKALAIFLRIRFFNFDNLSLLWHKISFKNDFVYLHYAITTKSFLVLASTSINITTNISITIIIITRCARWRRQWCCWWCSPPLPPSTLSTKKKITAKV